MKYFTLIDSVSNIHIQLNDLPDDAEVISINLDTSTVPIKAIAFYKIPEPRVENQVVVPVIVPIKKKGRPFKKAA